jgi:hypothetical protein
MDTTEAICATEVERMRSLSLCTHLSSTPKIA